MKAKRTITFITAAMTALSGFSAIGASAETVRSGDYLYRVKEDGTAELTSYYGYNSNIRSVTVPEKIDGITVTSLGVDGGEVAYGIFDEWLSCSGIEYLYVADTVTSMVEGTGFSGCKDLKYIDFGNGLTEISPLACEYLDKLEYVDIGANVKMIGAEAFLNCTSLKELHIPASVEKIDEYAVGYIFIDSQQEYTVDKDFTIYGAEGSAAQAYADENGIKFVVDIPTAVIRPLGDISGDGRLDTKDAMKSVQFALKKLTPKTDAEFTAADVNADGKLDSKDSMILINAAKNKTLI